MININPASTASLNEAQFSTPLQAAAFLTQPFIEKTQDSTEDVYSYKFYSADEFKTNFLNTDPLWQHGGPILGYRVPNQNYVAYTDCSGSVAKVLSATRPAGLSSSVYAKLVTQDDGSVRNFESDIHDQPYPSAQDYVSIISSPESVFLKPVTYTCSAGQQISRMGTFSLVQAGDILAYSLPLHSPDTGHVMIVADVQPLDRAHLTTGQWSSNLEEFTGNGLTFYAVTVYDSSNVMHFQDTRGTTTTGVGKGTVLLIVDATGAPVGFMFDAGDRLLQVVDVESTIPSAKVTPLGSLVVGRV